MSDHAAECPQMVGPGAEHKLLEQFVGTWNAKVQLWMGPGDPMESTGSMANSMDLDGRFLKDRLHRSTVGAPYIGLRRRLAFRCGCFDPVISDRLK